MGYYFEDHLSMFAQAGTDVQHSLNAISRRFVGANPPHPVTCRAYSRRGILRVGDYRYHADFKEFFPEAQNEQVVYAWAKHWSDGPAQLMFDITCFGPITIWCNGQEVWRSTIFTERYADAKHRVTLPQQAGWNHFVIRAKKTLGGFGWVFGSWLGKHPYTLMMPSPERAGQEGWLFTEPTWDDLTPLPGAGTSEKDSGIEWLPKVEWTKTEQKLGQLRRLYGVARSACAVGWTKVFLPRRGQSKYQLSGSHTGPIVIYLGDEEIFSGKSSGKIRANFDADFGEHDLMVLSTCDATDWGFELDVLDGTKSLPLKTPCRLQGCNEPWIYVGPLKPPAKFHPSSYRNLHRTHTSTSGETYWRVDLPDMWVRLYNENALYGRWNYPLGVTLYGLLNSARAIGSGETEKYIVDHMQLCADTFDYALWDRSQFGGATNIHTLLSSIDSLDDCGSFGSAFLEVAKDHPIKGMRAIADYVADYISNMQDRQPDGTFYRKKMMHIFHENTMWADDLYMSVPFLCRYAALTNDPKYLDDAANQFVGFKKKLFIPELKVMSHIFDLRRNLATGVPWGRGNGWTIFSLSELLAVLPESHEKRPALLEFFRELAAGFLALQDEQGMWHQVLTHPDSYPESSCTSMFTYAFCRGIRYGWLTKPEPYIQAVYKAWEGLNRVAIDRGGNIYGVCRGSEFSFTPEYYKKELPWNLNDTHGVGILLLAGVEVIKLTKVLQSRSKEKAS